MKATAIRHCHTSGLYKPPRLQLAGSLRRQQRLWCPLHTWRLLRLQQHLLAGELCPAAVMLQSKFSTDRRIFQGQTPQLLNQQLAGSKTCSWLSIPRGQRLPHPGLASAGMAPCGHGSKRPTWAPLSSLHLLAAMVVTEPARDCSASQRRAMTSHQKHLIFP